ncbi:gas vesicle protein K [Streptomyces piniterrae]
MIRRPCPFRAPAHALSTLPWKALSMASRRLKVDPETVERDLVTLVLTVVELLRQLMERTALHRADQGDLSAEQEERIGMTLMLLQDRMSELCETHGLTMDDLNLDLGPLGSLLPRSTDAGPTPGGDADAGTGGEETVGPSV